MVDVLSQKVVEWKHVRLFCAKEHVVGEVLNNLCNEKKATAHFLGRSR